MKGESVRTELEPSLEASLFTYFVGRNSIKRAMSFYRQSYNAICIDGVFTAFAQQTKAVRVQIVDQVPALD